MSRELLDMMLADFCLAHPDRTLESVTCLEVALYRLECRRFRRKARAWFMQP